MTEIALSLLAALAVALYRGVFTAGDPLDVYGGLSDAFFVPGILLVCFGLLAFAARGGVFDMISYGARSLWVLFTPFGKPEKHQRYYEYKLEKEAKRGKPKPRTLILGLVFLALSGLCLILYNGAGGA